MENSLNQRTKYTPGLSFQFVQAELELDALSRHRKTDLKKTKEIVQLLRETYETSLSSDKTSIIGSLEWHSALTTRLIPETYGIVRPMPNKKEHFEAGLYFILEQLEDLEHASPARLEFALNILCRLTEDLLSEKQAWYTQDPRGSSSSAYNRALAA